MRKPKTFSFDDVRDAKILRFLEQQENASATVREALRVAMGGQSQTTHDLLLQILAELAKRPAGIAVGPAQPPPMDEAHRKLGAMGRWD